VTLLDGTRDRAALAAQLAQDAGMAEGELAAGLERGLRALAKLALLV